MASKYLKKNKITLLRLTLFVAFSLPIWLLLKSRTRVDSRQHVMISPPAGPAERARAIDGRVVAPHPDVAENRFKELSEALKRGQHSPERTLALQELVRSWMKVDPLACMCFLEGLGVDPVRASLSRLAMQFWLSSDEPSAIRYSIERISAKSAEAEFLLAPILQNMLKAGQGFSDIARFLKVLPPDGTIYAEVTPFYGSYLQKDLSGALAFAKGIEIAAVRSAYLEMAGTKEADEQGIAILDTLKYARQLGISSEEELGIICKLLADNRGETLRWLQTQPVSAELDVPRFRAAILECQSNPQGAIQDGLLISDPALRKRALGQALEVWASQDYQGAEDWAVYSGLPVEMVAPILLAAQGTPSSTTLEQKMSGLAAGTASKEQQRAEMIVFSQWAKVDRKAAEMWLDKSSLPQGTKEALHAMIQ